jgi:hypothetical protein
MAVVTVVAMAIMVAASSFAADPVAGGTLTAFASADIIDIWLIRAACAGLGNNNWVCRETGTPFYLPGFCSSAASARASAT